MKTKLIITSFLLFVLNLAVFGQFSELNSYEEFNALAIEHFKTNNLDSSIFVIKYARTKFPDHDKEATFSLDFLYARTNQDSMSLVNWDYGLKKRYLFGLELNWNSSRFENNPEFNRLLKIDNQIRDSLTNLSHVEYEVVLPTMYSTDKKYPVLFVFHGNNWNIQREKNVWTSGITKEKFIVVFVQSYIHMSNFGFQWLEKDERTNREFKEIYEQIINVYPVINDKIIFSAMSAGGKVAIDYAFNQFVPVYGLVLNCPVIPNISDSSIDNFVTENKKIGIITGETDWAIDNQNLLINKVDQIGGNNKITINAGIGHQYSNDFSTLLDDYLSWMLE